MKINTKLKTSYNAAEKIEKSIIDDLNQEPTREHQLLYLNNLLNLLTPTIKNSQGLTAIAFTELKFRYDLLTAWKGLLNLGYSRFRDAINYYPYYRRLGNNPYDNILKEKVVMGVKCLVDRCYNLIVERNISIFVIIDTITGPYVSSIKNEKLFEDRYPGIFTLDINRSVLIPVIKELYANNKLAAIEFFIKGLYSDEYEYLFRKTQKLAYFNNHGAVLIHYYKNNIACPNVYLSYLVENEEFYDIEKLIKNQKFSPTRVIQYSLLHEVKNIFDFFLQKYHSAICFTVTTAWAIEYNRPYYLECLSKYDNKFNLDQAFKALTRQTKIDYSPFGDKISDYSIHNSKGFHYFNDEQVQLLLKFGINHDLLLNYISTIETQLYAPEKYNGLRRNLSILPKLMKELDMDFISIKSINLKKRYFANLWNLTQFFLDNHTNTHYPTSTLYCNNFKAIVAHSTNIIAITDLFENINHSLSIRKSIFSLEDLFILHTEKALIANGKVTPFGIAAMAFYNKIVYPFHNLPEEIIYKILSYTFMPGQYTAPEIQNWGLAIKRDMCHTPLIMIQKGTQDVREIVSYPHVPVNINVTKDLAILWQQNYTSYIVTGRSQNALKSL